MALAFGLAAQILLEILKLERKILLLTTYVLEVGAGWRNACSVLPIDADQGRALQVAAAISTWARHHHHQLSPLLPILLGKPFSLLTSPILFSRKLDNSFYLLVPRGRMSPRSARGSFNSPDLIALLWLLVSLSFLFSPVTFSKSQSLRLSVLQDPVLGSSFILCISMLSWAVFLIYRIK